jgi:hypothetical protein
MSSGSQGRQRQRLSLIVPGSFALGDARTCRYQELRGCFAPVSIV